MPVSPARAAAFDILLRVERDAAYTSELLHSTTHDRLSTPDHALTTELVMGVLRWRSRLDDEIAQASSQPLAKLDLEVLIAIRLALYQFRWLDRIPQRAALHESVELAKRERKRSAAPFVNAVLRKLASSSPPPDNNLSSRDDLARAFAHPLWMVERWANAYGLAAARKICEHDQSIPQTAIRLRSATAQAELDQEKISLAAGSLLNTARRVISGDLTKTKAFLGGGIVIQDEASQLVAALVGNNTTDRILDCCAAPGGKTLAMADRNPEAAIIAVELHPHRARLLQRLLHQRDAQTATRVKVVTADVERLPAKEQFHRVLADVPCSGTGTLARNPEIKWRLTDSDTELAQRQKAILLAAMDRTTPGGRVVYSTCSLEKQENEDVIEQTLAENQSFRVVDVRPELDRLQASGELIWPDPPTLTRGPYLRTIPGVHPCDGFFAAILEKI